MRVLYLALAVALVALYAVPATEATQYPITYSRRNAMCGSVKLSDFVAPAGSGISILKMNYNRNADKFKRNKPFGCRRDQKCLARCRQDPDPNKPAKGSWKGHIQVRCDQHLGWVLDEFKCKSKKAWRARLG